MCSVHLTRLERGVERLLNLLDFSFTISLGIEGSHHSWLHNYEVVIYTRTRCTYIRGETWLLFIDWITCVCVCVCVCARARVCVRVCACMCVWESVWVLRSDRSFRTSTGMQITNAVRLPSHSLSRVLDGENENVFLSTLVHGKRKHGFPQRSTKPQPTLALPPDSASRIHLLSIKQNSHVIRCS